MTGREAPAMTGRVGRDGLRRFLLVVEAPGSRHSALRGEDPKLALNAVEQLAVGVAERLHALALELRGRRREIDACPRGLCERFFRGRGVSIERAADFAVVGESA